MPTALITGITGQDGSYLAEHLLDLGYRVVGVTRRTSSYTGERIEHLGDRIELIGADLLDQTSLLAIVDHLQPDEVYNLAAQSFVPASWQQPVLTSEVTALGVTRLLEAVRLACPSARVYQASSSEMFGMVTEAPQNERTPFYPRSPYGVSKLYGHWIAVNYRESYGMFVVSGILFNHECLAASTPLLVRRCGRVEVALPEDLIPLRRKGKSQQSYFPPDLQVWDGTEWTSVNAITATRRRRIDSDHELLWVQARGGIVEVTAHHRMIDAEGVALPAAAVCSGCHLALFDTFPDSPSWTVLNDELAELLGLLVAEGYVHPGGRIQFTNDDLHLCERVSELWSRLFMGTAVEQIGESGWNPDRSVNQLRLNSARAVGRWLREELYTKSGMKRVPPLVLNARANVQAAFLRGYYAGDGLKAGNGDSVKTNSPLLAQGLCWLYANLGRTSSVYAELRNGRVYYQLNIASGEAPGNKGAHLRQPASEVRRVDKAAITEESEWVFDIETESGRFCAGVGRLVVRNSPRRGREFVTRKITHRVARIARGLDSQLRLGNLDARRDWGYAPDYVRAMHQMLQVEQPRDYVVATGETHSVREFCQFAFSIAGLDWQDHVVVDPSLRRPAEVDSLVGDASDARRDLGWAPTVTFPELVRIMVEADLRLVGGELGRNQGQQSLVPGQSA
jgi:GDPmannose 4,6-dehydratase